MEEERPLLEEGSCVDRGCHGRAEQTWGRGAAGRPAGADLVRREPRRSSHVSKVRRLETAAIKEGPEGRPHLETAASFPCFLYR